MFSHQDEDVIIQELFKHVKVEQRFCVDVGAGDGSDGSNTYNLYRQGWEGLSVECDAERFAYLAQLYKLLPAVRLSRTKVTPDNVAQLLAGHETPREFGLLSLDIDGYDYFVLDRILEDYRPSLVVCEVNEKIPPPVKFTVKYDSEYSWGSDHFYGQSLAQLDELCQKKDYVLLMLEYNNAFCVPRELNCHEVRSVGEVYRLGYLDRADRKEKFPWNADFEEIYGLEPAQQVEFVNERYAKYAGKFTCRL